MLTLSGAHRIYLACGVTDLRKSIDGLAPLVQHRFGVSPFEPSLFVFCKLQRDKLKMLYWDHNGFWLFYRLLTSRGVKLFQQTSFHPSCYFH
ncbi:MAG: transposase [Paenibacillus sp.]|jgi:transposase|nr:transposase [Paenibacillus sp.]